jgi:Ca-activated chloride channel homolog
VAAARGGRPAGALPGRPAAPAGVRGPLREPRAARQAGAATAGLAPAPRLRAAAARSRVADHRDGEADQGHSGAARPRNCDDGDRRVALDVSPNRLEAAQAAAKEFVGLLPPRINLGLVTFSGTASVAVAPTTDRASVLRAIDSLELAERTAIGEAIFSCLDAIKTFQAQLQGQDAAEEGSAPARLVLMSDGSNTWGRSPEQAAGAAKQSEIPVSTIAFGTDEGYIELEGDRVAVPVNHEQLRGIAEGTGGSYYAAASAEELGSVYRDLGSQIGYTTERREITTWFVGTGLLLAFAAAGVSLAWSNRLL